MSKFKKLHKYFFQKQIFNLVFSHQIKKFDRLFVYYDEDLKICSFIDE